METDTVALRQRIGCQRSMFPSLPLDILDLIADALTPPLLGLCNPYFHPYCRTCDPSSYLVPLTRLCRGLTPWAEAKLYHGFVDVKSGPKYLQGDELDLGDCRSVGGRMACTIFMETLARRTDLRPHVKKLRLQEAWENQATLATLCPQLESLWAWGAVAALCGPPTLRDLAILVPSDPRTCFSPSLLAQIITDLPDLRSLLVSASWRAEWTFGKVLNCRNLTYLKIIRLNFSQALGLAASISPLIPKLNIQADTRGFLPSSLPPNLEGLSLSELVVPLEVHDSSRVGNLHSYFTSMRYLRQLTFLAPGRTLEQFQRYNRLPSLPIASTLLPNLQRIIFLFPYHARTPTEDAASLKFLLQFLEAIRVQDISWLVESITMRLCFSRWGGLEEVMRKCKGEFAHFHWTFEPVAGYERWGGRIIEESIVLKYHPIHPPLSPPLTEGVETKRPIARPVVTDNGTTPADLGASPSGSIAANRSGLLICFPVIVERLALWHSPDCYDCGHPLCPRTQDGFRALRRLLRVCSTFRHYLEPIAYRRLRPRSYPWSTSGGPIRKLQRTLEDRRDLAACVRSLVFDDGPLERDSEVLGLCSQATHLLCDTIALAFCPVPKLSHLRIRCAVSSSELSELLVRHPNLEVLELQSCSLRHPLLPLAISQSRIKLRGFAIERYPNWAPASIGPLPPVLCRAPSLIEVSLPFEGDRKLCLVEFVLAHTGPSSRLQTLRLLRSQYDHVASFPDVDWALLQRISTLKHLRITWLMASSWGRHLLHFPLIPPHFTVPNIEDLELCVWSDLGVNADFGDGFVSSLIPMPKPLYRDALMAIDITDTILSPRYTDRLQEALDKLGVTLVKQKQYKSREPQDHYCRFRWNKKSNLSQRE